jgi:hypothetical protein
MKASRDIKVSYRSMDRFSKTRRFRTVEGAQKFAQEYVGETPEMGSFYAVSGDGIGRVTVEGATLKELFPKLADEDYEDDTNPYDYDGTRTRDCSMNTGQYIVRSQINPRMILCVDGEFYADTRVGPGRWAPKIYKTLRGAERNNPGRIVIPLTEDGREDKDSQAWVTCRAIMKGIFMAPQPAPLMHKFGLGQTVITRDARARFTGEFIQQCLSRHHQGDWGDLGEDDKARNDTGLDPEHLGRLHSSFKAPEGKLWVITEWDRSVTTVLLPEDY